MSLPTTTRAAVLTERGADLQLQDLPLPDVLEAGSAIVKIACSTLCGTDVEIWRGRMGTLPMVPGHEMIGTVVAVGDGTLDALGRTIGRGDRIGWSEATCGHCYGCTIERNPVHCEHRVYMHDSVSWPWVIGGFTEYSYVQAGSDKLVLPDTVKDTWASMAGCAAKTVLHAFDRMGGVKPGSRVVVQGAGALGIFATAVARIQGAAQVITVGGPDGRLEAARRFGADETVSISLGSDGIVERVLELTGGRGADHVFDFAGAPTVGAEAVGMAAQRGTFTIVGSVGSGMQQMPLSAIMGREMTVTGSLNGDIADYYHAVRFFETFADRMPWDELFSAPVGLSGASGALAAMASQDAIKAVVDPSLP